MSSCLVGVLVSFVQQHNRGVALMGQFDYAGAWSIFARLVERHPSWLDARLDLAIATLNRQKPGDSEAAASLLDDEEISEDIYGIINDYNEDDVEYKDRLIDDDYEEGEL